MNKKLSGFRIDEETKNLAYESIKIRGIHKMGKSENFSEFIRNLIIEEWKRQKASITNNKPSN
jgi:hypothetical protein